MGWDYSEKTKRIFMDAVQGKPGTHLGEIENADGLGEHGSIACGDAMRFTFRVEKHPTDPLKDVIEALKITNKDIADYLDGLPQQKIHCSVMGAEALEAAVFNWAKKRGVDLEELGVDIHPNDQDEGRIVCQCFNLTEPYIRRKIKELNLKTIPEITGAIKAGGACMSCHHVPGGLQDLLDEIWGREPTRLKEGSKEPGSRKAERPAELSPFHFSKEVEKTLDEYIRPMLQKDHGDLELLDIKDRLVYVKLTGACAGCIGASQTLKLMVEQTLKDRVDERIRVIAA